MSPIRTASTRRPVTDAAEFGRVALLLGGTSAEREISLQTGQAVLAALRARGVDVAALDPAEAGLDALMGGAYDRVWLALHGRGGEDGLMQGALETIGLPYTGSGVLGSAVSMDKLRSKQLFRAWGLDTPEWAVMSDPAEAPAIVAELGLPLIVKPASEGSSVGMSKVEAAAALPAAWAEAARYDECVLVERWVEGGEYSVGVLQGEALPIIRIETPRVFYDYEAKYFSDDTRYFCPAGLDDAFEAACRAAALTAFDAVGASGWGRVDFLMGADRRPRFLEVNTIPGMTSHSLVPMGAKAAGIDFEELVWRVLETSMTTEGGDGA
jgi:D-alanine-D-alanine ligase